MDRELIASLNAMGISLTGGGKASGRERVDIEQTLIDACYLVENDSRLLGLLMSWVLVHGKYLITEKFLKLYKLTAKFRGECPWFYALLAFGAESGIHKFKKGILKQKEKVYFRGEKSPALFKMKGAIKYLEKINIMVPEGSIRIREKDIFPANILVRKNQQFKNRLLYGANWRADIITAIEEGMENPYRISKELGCSYDPAYRVFNEYKLAMGA